MLNLRNKVILIALISIIFVTFASTVFAIADTNEFYVGTQVASAAPSRETGKFEQIVGRVLGVILIIGTIVAVGGIMVLGIQAMTGSVAEKAVYKQKMIPFIVGFVILLSSATLVKILYDVFRAPAISQPGGGGHVPNPGKPTRPEIDIDED